MSTVCLGCVQGVSRMCPGCVQGVSIMCLGCVYDVSRVCLGCVYGGSRGRKRQTRTSYHTLIDTYYLHSRYLLNIYSQLYLFRSIAALSSAVWASSQRSKHGGLGRLVDGVAALVG